MATDDKLFFVFGHISGPLAAAVFCLAASANGAIREEASLDAMGSVITVVAYSSTAERARTAVVDSLAEARRLDSMLSNYKPESEWSEMNRRAADGPMRVSSELFELLAKCVEYSRESQGAFDISVGPLMKVWGFYKGTGHMAGQRELAAAMRVVSYTNILLDRHAQTVRFAIPGVDLDPGGIGKGYAVDRMVDVLRREGIRDAFVSAGGSSIYALGAPPGEGGWRVKLKDPTRPANPAATARLRDESLSTSGSYEKFFMADGKRWSHIMDPRTGMPAAGMASVSVIAPNTIDSEAWAKPYFILGKAWAKRHRQTGFRIFMCEDAPGKTCAWI